MESVCLWRRAVVCVLLASTAGAFAAGRSDALSTPEFLLELARDHGLKCQGAQTAGDVERVRALLRAALRLNPRLAEAYVWLHELAVLGDEEQEAREMVAGLLAVDPTHRGAFARWLESEQQTRQTVEDQAVWLESLAADESRPRELRAMVQLRLARLAQVRLNAAGAGQHLQKALALDPTNPEVVALRLELLDPDASTTTRLQALLAFLAVSPFHVDTAWEIGLLLDQFGLYADADVFYEHAQEVYAQANPDASLPGSCLLQLARHELELDKLDDAAWHAEQAIRADPQVAGEAGMFCWWLLSRQGRRAQADELQQQLGERFAQLNEPNEWPVNEVAQAAWFYCTLDPQAQRALMLAQNAAGRAPGDVFVVRVLGWAQMANLQTLEALQTLLPIAGQDPYAAYRLASMSQEAGDEEAARRVVRDLALVPPAGLARELFAELDLETLTPAAVERQLPQLRAALAGFNGALLRFHREPERFVEATVELDERSPTPGQPWWAEFKLTNRTDIPITLGPEWMVNPVFLLSFELEGDRERAYPYLLTVTIGRARVLPPGGTLRERRTIDLGPLRRVLRQTPQHAQRVTLEVLLDPVRNAAGEWTPSLGGQKLRPIYLNRVPALITPEAQHALFRALTGESRRARFLAVERMAELLGEKQRADLGWLNYRPQPVPAQRLQQALLAALGSESWELRVRALDAIQICGLDARMLRAVQLCQEHPHWLVRLMAARLLGERCREQSADTLRELARDDEDELVRAMAASYLKRQGAERPTTRPASSQPAALPADEGDGPRQGGSD